MFGMLSKSDEIEGQPLMCGHQPMHLRQQFWARRGFLILGEKYKDVFSK